VGDVVPRLTRLLVLGSIVLAAFVGLWPFASAPALTGALLVVGTAAVARRSPDRTAYVILALAYVAYGLLRLAAGPTIAGMPFWLAAFTGLVIGGSSWTGWLSPRPWRWPLAWWATGVALSWPGVAAGGPGDQRGAVIVTALVQMNTAIWMDRLMGEAASREPDAAHPARFAWPLAVSAAITALAAHYQRWVDLTWLSHDLWAGAGRAVGLMGDANPMAVATALWAPIVLTMIIHGGSKHGGSNHTGSNHGGSEHGGSTPVASRRRGRTAGRARAEKSRLIAWLKLGVGLALAALLWGAAWVSGARSTLILVAVGGAGLAMAMAYGRHVGRRLLALGTAVGVVVSVLAVVVLARSVQGTPAWRLLVMMPDSPREAAYEILWRRDGYGLAAVEAIKESPIHGIGIGRFMALSPSYYARVEGRPIPPDNGQNLWRHTLAERGVLGLAPVLWMTVLAIGTLRGRIAGPIDVVLRAMLMGVGLTLIVGYPVQEPSIAVTLAALAAMCAAPVRWRATRAVANDTAPHPAQERPMAGSPNESSESVGERAGERWIWLAMVGAAALGAALDFRL
jgi:hypothetical protein